jgi:NAD-dependent SIR2 family protein deacetylase
MRHGVFAYTSNVDGHFQRAGFHPDRILEVHGAIDWMQCTRSCGVGLFDVDHFQLTVDETTMRATPPLPACPSCGALARPNILMFGDADWDYARACQQEVRLDNWLQKTENSRMAIIECGAGTAVPTVRHFCERVATTHNATLIRINRREPAVPYGHIGLARGALEALRALDTYLR